MVMSPANFSITVQNTGEVTLNNVQVVDPQALSCNNFLGSLAPGGSMTYACTQSGVNLPFVNTVECNVEGWHDAASLDATPMLLSS